MPHLQTGVKLITRALAIAFISLLGACAGTFYVDDNLHDLAPSERVAVATPKPVQLLFDFQTKGAPNTKARDIIKGTVVKAVQDSGLFSAVSDDPQPNGAILQITINNIPITDDAFAKGFAVGFTFGLVGATVGDGYVCTVDYVGGPTEPKITKQLRDALYMSMGATATKPEHAHKVGSGDEAVTVTMRKVVANTLNELARDPAFNK